jgi:5,10-methylenetetrahydromethanopterin reductase
MKMNFAIGMGRNERMDEIAELARLADEYGFSHATFVDEPYLARDVHVMATVAALNTKRLVIGQGVVDPQTYHPSALANAAASLHELTGGRAFLGLGAGGPFGKLMARPIGHKALREAVQFVRKFLDGDEAEYYGQDMVSEWIGNRRVPIYLAADGPKALELAGEIADGVIFMGGPPDYVKWKVESVYRGAEKVGRDPTKIDICVRSYVYVTDDKQSAHRELAGFVPFGAHVFHRYTKIAPVMKVFERLDREQPGIVDDMKQFFAGAQAHSRQDGYNPWFEKIDAPYAHLMSMRQIECIHIVGSVEEICEKIHALGEVGVTTIATANYTIIDKKRMITDVGEQIMPHFRS